MNNLTRFVSFAAFCFCLLTTSCGPISPADQLALCMLSQCDTEVNSCFLDDTCLSSLNCQGGCSSAVDPQKCNIECSVSYSSPLMDDVMACTNAQGCFTDSDYTCPLPQNSGQLATIGVVDLQGDWFVVRGLSQTYDCWNCQRYRFNQTSATVADYEYLYTVDSGVTGIVPSVVTAAPFDGGAGTATPGRFKVDYETVGMPGQDQWFVLDHSHADYMLIYYCGAAPGTTYKGGVVLTRTPAVAIPQSVLDGFDAALINANIADAPTMGAFCVNDNTFCPAWLP